MTPDPYRQPVTRSYVEGSIRFLGRCQGKPIFFGRQRELDNLPLETRTVRIENMRSLLHVTVLDREGFVLVRSPSAVCDFFESAGRVEYLRECEALVRRLTGAVEAIALGNGVIRRSERSPRFREHGTTVPGRFAHCDFSDSPDGSSRWVEQMLPPQEARFRLGRRFAIYNVWRALSDPPQDAPLAVCDARSVRAQDCVRADQVIDPLDGPEQRIENTVFRYSPSQRWCFFPDMTREEAIVFKGFDSDSSRAGGIAHAAFDDPDCSSQTPPRESIDERVIAFF